MKKRIAALLISLLIISFHQTSHSQYSEDVPSYFSDLTILGGAIATKEQCIAYLTSINPFPLINTSIEELVDLYYEEGLKEGIRPDVAFAQAILETGHFRFGGDVLPFQNNYAGIGAVGNNEKGAIFRAPVFGVRGHIQHLLVYAANRLPHEPIVDPRYELVAGNPVKHGKVQTWIDLGGNWAVPGEDYGKKILRIHNRIISTPRE